MKQFGYILLLAIGLLSCGTNFPEEIEVAKDLKLKVESAKKELNQIDINKVAVAKERYTSDMTVFKHKYNPDTINQAQANMISEYKYIKKGARLVLSQYQDLKKTLDVSENQLEKLIYDMENNLWEPSEVEKYIEEERLRAAGVVSNTRNVKETHDKLIRIFDSLSPKVERIVDSLRKL